jgi:protein arginine kinase activator
MSFQKCEKCDRPATHKFTRIVNGEVADFYFCQEHAAQFSPLQTQSALSQLDLTQLLAGLLKTEQGQKAGATETAAAELKCRTCGLSFRQYRQTMRLGCGDCYGSFEKQIREDLRRYHGTVRHVGRQPQAAGGEGSHNEAVEALKKRLTLAIQDEDFELAAQLRDQIRQIGDQRPKTGLESSGVSGT